MEVCWFLLKKQFFFKFIVNRDLKRQASYHAAPHVYNLRRCEFFLIRLWIDVYVECLQKGQPLKHVISNILPEKMNQYEQRNEKDWDNLISEVHEELKAVQDQMQHMENEKLSLSNPEFKKQVDKVMEQVLPRIAYQMSLLPPDD